MAKVTVIIPSYNAEPFVERCLSSLNGQDYKDFDVIIVDDASKDNTVGKLNELASRVSFKLTVLRNAENAGPAASRNKGICHASSEYICFCDSDDWYDSNFLSAMVGRVEKDISDIAFCGYKVVAADGRAEQRPLLSEKEILTAEEALSLDADSLCMMIVRTDLMKDTLLPNIRNGEDMAVIPLLIAKTKRCSVVRECLYNYYRNDRSASQTATMRSVDSLVLSFEHVRENFPQQHEKVLEYLGVRNLLYAGIITLFSVSYHVKKAKEIVKAFEMHFPAWHENPQIRCMPAYKRLVLGLVHKRCYIGVYMVAWIRKLVTGIR